MFGCSDSMLEYMSHSMDGQSPPCILTFAALKGVCVLGGGGGGGGKAFDGY